ncbi:hypothetical protein [Streptomyces sp. NPDC048057]|uniref:hypothetical protein n=1 Tax=Streptomyces sp. NPDC048057 TaxID=3155628 RepID=UPI00340ED427
MPYVNEVETPESVFVCAAEGCTGVIEASAMGWLNIDKGGDGNPVLSVFGFSEGNYVVACSECGEKADGELDSAVHRIIYGAGGKDWFRG